LDNVERAEAETAALSKIKKILKLVGGIEFLLYL
jgi:hypothetical protein